MFCEVDMFMARPSKKEGKETMKMSEHVLKKDWDNKYDELWNKY